MASRSSASGAKGTSITQVAPQHRELQRQSAHPVVRRSAHQATHSRCSLNRQPRASDARPCTALCARRYRRIRAQHRSDRMTAVYIPALNRTTSVRTTRAYRCTNLSGSRETVSRNCRNAGLERAPKKTRAASLCCTQLIPIALRECHNSSVAFWRLGISTGDSQPITAGLPVGCRDMIHANSTPIPPQTHNNR